MNDSILIFNIQKYSVHDGPGIRTIVFFKGCPLHCKWCSNPESQCFEPELLYYPEKCIGCGKCVEACESECFDKLTNGAFHFDRSTCANCCACTDSCYVEARHKSGKWMGLEEIKNEVNKDLMFYKNSGGGVTFSGGEAMCFPELVKTLAKYYKEVQGVSTAIETCGCVPWGNYEMVIPYLDLAMYDLKCMDDERHIHYTGASNTRILDNLTRISKCVDTVVRIPIIPGFNDSYRDIEEFALFVKDLGTVNTIHILAYHNYGMSKYDALGRDYQMKELESPSEEDMQKIKKQLERYEFNVNIGG